MLPQVNFLLSFTICNAHFSFIIIKYLPVPFIMLQVADDQNVSLLQEHVKHDYKKHWFSSDFLNIYMAKTGKVCIHSFLNHITRRDSIISECFHVRTFPFLETFCLSTFELQYSWNDINMVETIICHSKLFC